MSTYSIDERLTLAEEMGCKLDKDDWNNEELVEFLDDIDVPRSDDDEDQ